MRSASVRGHARAGQDHLERLAPTHHAGQPLRSAAARDDAEVHLGEPELGVLRGDADVAGERQLEPAAEGEAADGRDDGLRAPVHLAAVVEALALLAKARGHGRLEELLDVRPRREGALARARDDDGPHVLVLSQVGEDAEQFPAHGIVLGIERGGAVERDRDDVVLPVDEDRLVRHAGRSFPTTTWRRARSAMSASA